MTERAATVMAVVAFVAALNPQPIPLILSLAVGVLALASRRSTLVILAVAVLCSSLAWRSWGGLASEPPTTVDAIATLVTDPVRAGGQTTVVVRVDDTRYLASAFGGPAARLQNATAGERLAVVGSSKPYNGSRERKAALHVADRLTIQSFEHLGGTSPPWVMANAIRSTIDAGANSLGEDQKALFTGLVYGDDRNQAPRTEVDFRLVGLTHLLAVSGQNVAYVLTVLGPAIRRYSVAGRWLTTLAVLGVFATATRFEPSVLRATVMASLAVTARVVGRDVPTSRLLAVAVTLLLMVDPLLAETIAFRLSVAASAGIVWLSKPIERRLRGADWLRA
ncbi:MAG: ComEC/Rec2 family competence protein, partial [Acidimicrobiales bacterium]